MHVTYYILYIYIYITTYYIYIYIYTMYIYIYICIYVHVFLGRVQRVSPQPNGPILNRAAAARWTAVVRPAPGSSLGMRAPQKGWWCLLFFFNNNKYSQKRGFPLINTYIYIYSKKWFSFNISVCVYIYI